jgi:predicted SprT family Zn-dependent metalloprotease
LNFLSKEGMEKHYMRVHEGKGVTMTRFKCDKCDAEFDTKQDFKKHKVPQKFPCDGCKTSLTSTKLMTLKTEI